jgi:AcrR family transcriptional regulator
LAAARPERRCEEKTVRQAGRRPGATATREEILAAARRLFAAKGYDGTTIRGIAAEAGVNPALVHHFFGAKQQVFVTALDIPIVPADVLQTVILGPREEVGQRLVRVFLAMWDDPTARTSFLALLRSATVNEQAAAMFRQFIDAVVLRRLAATLHVPKERLIAAAAQMVGLAILRYVVRVEPIASSDNDAIVLLVGPVIQRYIDGG